MIGLKIKKAIEKSDLSPDQVAAHADMSVANLYKIYKRDSVESRYLVKIAEVLGKPVDYFLYDEDEEERATHQVTGGTGNAGRDIRKQKIMPQEREGANSGVYNEEYSKIVHELELCRTEKASLVKEVQLKDEIIELLKKKV